MNQSRNLSFWRKYITGSSSLLCCFSLHFLLLLFCFARPLQAQDGHVSGNVKDAKTGEALAFVHILVNNGTYGGTTDIDGRFSFETHEPVKTIRCSYVGYETRQFETQGQCTQLVITLNPKTLLLNEVVVVPGENPAHRIIKNVVGNKDRNDPKNLSAFAYTSYDKMVLTLDTTNAGRQHIARSKNLVADHDLFLMESVTERTYLAPGHNHEKVVASKVSGFRDPIFVFLISQLQSTDFYDAFIRISDKHYVSPISPGSTRKYLFELEESTPLDGMDTLFRISFRPLINTNFDGLTGQLMIRTKGWAIQNVVASPAHNDNGLGISIQQMYALQQDSLWFPVQLNTTITFSDIALGDSGVNYPLVGIGKSYLSQIVINPGLARSKFDEIALEVAADANAKSGTFWSGMRTDSLSAREAETYRIIDSIGQARHFDQMAGSLQLMLAGRIPWNKLDIELDKLFRYNAYEGFYAGIGLRTNTKFSSRFTAGGFWGYGFNDKTAKYGLNAEVLIDRKKEARLQLACAYSATETGGVTFMGEEEKQWSLAGFRHFFVNRMDMTRAYSLGFSFRALQHFTWYGQGSVQHKKSGYAYYFGDSLPNTVIAPEYDFSEISLGTRFALREKFVRTPNGLVSLGTPFPVFWINFTHGMKGLFNSEFRYKRLDVRFEKSVYFRYLGKTSLRVQAGLISGDVPMTRLYNSPASWRSFALYAPFSFGTMRMNEFLSDRYVNIHFTHDFGKLLYRSGSFQPEFAVETNVAFGSLAKPEKHQLIAFKTLEKGFYESGLLINNLLRLPALKTGFGVFYRYGPYGFTKVSANFGYKISMQVGL
ncbi:MAG: carboxypeptidase-like regulatory domain-containing protein [Bacteroidales bacterium]|nr:carboxypeptidase-like regulatory domain-containing protein [Bacteroidales bacterium]